MLNIGTVARKGRITTVVANRGDIELTVRSAYPGTANLPAEFAKASFSPKFARKVARMLVEAADATEGRVTR